MINFLLFVLSAGLEIYFIIYFVATRVNAKFSCSLFGQIVARLLFYFSSIYYRPICGGSLLITRALFSGVTRPHFRINETLRLHHKNNTLFFKDQVRYVLNGNWNGKKQFLLEVNKSMDRKFPLRSISLNLACYFNRLYFKYGMPWCYCFYDLYYSNFTL